MKKCFAIAFYSLFVLSVFIVEAAAEWSYEKPLSIPGKTSVRMNGNVDMGLSGTIELQFCVNRDFASGHEVFLFDGIGTPEWWNRLTLMVKREGDKLRFHGIFSGNKPEEYVKGVNSVAIHLKPAIPFSSGKWHTIRFSWWKNAENQTTVLLFVDDNLLDCETKLINSKKNPPAMVFGRSYIKSGAIKQQGGVMIKNIKVTNRPVFPGLTESKVQPDLKSRARANRLERQVKIDGIINSDEIANLSLLTLFKDFQQSGELAACQTKVWTGYDDKGMYIAVKSFKSPLKARGEARRRDENVWEDDSFEVILTPSGQPVSRTYHLIINAFSSIADEIIYDDARRDMAWNGKWEYKSKDGELSWDAELWIDWDELGIKSPMPGDTWRVNFARNDNNAREKSIWSMSEGIRSFFAPQYFGYLEFVKSKEFVNDIDFPVAGIGGNKISIASGPKPLTADFVYSDTAGNRKVISKLPKLYFSCDASGKSQAVLKLSNDGKTLFQQFFKFHVVPQISMTVNPEYTSGYIEFNINRSLFMPGVSLTGELVLTRLTDPSEKIKLQIKSFEQKISIIQKTDGLKSGMYNVALVLRQGTQDVYTESSNFEILSKPGELNRTAGTSPVVPAPWTPLKTSGHDISCWGRTYSFGNGVFPVSIKSLGKDILAGQMYFEYTHEDVPEKLSGGTFAIIGGNEAESKFKGNMEDSNFRITADGTMCFDGALLYNIKIESLKSQVVKNFSFNVPLDSAYAKYFINCFNGYYNENLNHIESMKDGEKRQFKFMNNFGFGGDRRGLQIFVESDEGWIPYGRDNVIELEKRKDTINLRFNIIANRVIKKPLNLVMGFIATPTRDINYKKNSDNSKIFIYWPGGPFYEDSRGFSYDVLDLDKISAAGFKNIIIFEFWSRYYGGIEAFHPEEMKKFIKRCHEKGLKVLLYRSGKYNENEPAMRYYNKLWYELPLKAFDVYKKYRPSGTAIQGCTAAPDFIDYEVGSVLKIIEQYDIDGIYYDWVVQPCKNLAHKCGYDTGKNVTKVNAGTESDMIGVNIINDDSYTTARPTLAMLPMRETWLRVYRALKEKLGDKGIIIVHSDAPGTAFYMNFCDVAYHSEAVACNKAYPWLPTDGEYQWFMSKQNLGIPSVIINYSIKNMGPYRNSQECLALSLLYGEYYVVSNMGQTGHVVPDFIDSIEKVWNTLDNFGVDDAEFIQFDRVDDYVKVIRGEKVHVSLWKKDKKVLLVVSNLSQKSQSVELELKQPVKKILNLDIPARSFKFVEVTG